MNIPVSKLLGAAIIGAMIVTTLPNRALADAEAANQPIDELVTTVRKTKESKLEVPLAITAFSEAELDAAQILGVQDLAAMTPGMSFIEFFGEQLPTPVIRGIAQVDIFGLPNVATFVDNIYVSSRTGINVGFLDFERVEVVKGPQSTLYGQNAFSGAINYVTKRPGPALEVNAEVTGGSDDLIRTRVSVGGPLVSGTLSGRAALLYSDFGGTYDNRSAIKQDIGGSEHTVFNGTLWWTPGEDWDIAWNLYYEDASIDPPANGTTPANCEPVLDDPNDPTSINPDRLLAYCGEIPPINRDSLGTVRGETGQEREVARTNLRIELEKSWGIVDSLTGYSKTTGEDFSSGNSGSSTGTRYAYQTDTPSFGPAGPPFLLDTFDSALVIASVGESEVQDISQEFRYLSPLDRTTRWSTGLYFYQEEDESPIASNDGLMSFTPLPDDFGSFCPCAEFFPGNGVSAGFGDFIFGPWFGYAPFGPPPPFPPEQIGTAKDERSQVAIYGSLEQDFGDRWTGRAEIRYTDEEAKFERPIDGTVESGKNSWEYWTGRINLDFKPTDRSMVYGSIANGKKPGKLGPTLVDVVDPDSPTGEREELFLNPVDPEENITYELGYKSAYLDQTLVIDLAVYYIDWQDIVLRQTVTEIEGEELVIPTAIDVNAGDGESTGFEFGLQWQLIEQFNLGFGYSYTDAELTSGTSEKYDSWPSFAPDGDMAGQKLPRQPENQANLNATWAQNFTADWGWYVRGDIMYRSEWFTDLDNKTVIPAMTQANLRVGLESSRWTIELWGRNLNDNDEVAAAYRDVYFSNALPDGTNNFDTLFPFRMTYANPLRRQWGITLRARF